ncbi:MAG TPA: heavy metal translocating P-type ATPase [Pseudomonadaceae bacterium]|nr:heavy metal translocating P-type ATPase [Pseudomonadaceae bacterium]
MKSAASACWHCNEPLPAAPPLVHIDGVEHAVCCQGCAAASTWIEQLGLRDYYRLRSEPALRPDAAQHSAALWADAELSRHAVRKQDDGNHEICLLLDGLRCSACVWLIERSLSGLAGLRQVSINPTAQRAQVVFDPQQTSLVQILERIECVGYRALPLDAHALDDARKSESRVALKRLLVAGFGTMQAMMYASALYLGAFEDMDVVTRDWFRWLGLLVATPVIFYSARPFFAGARRCLSARRLGMDVPVALAIGLIFAASVVEALRGGEEVYFDSVSMFVFFLLVGRYLEMRARHHAGQLSDALARLTPAFADRLDAQGRIERIPAVALKVGDKVHVAEGGLVPADGVLLSRHCNVDEALLSGESVPVSKHQGEPLIAGSVMCDGPAQLRVERVGSDTVLSGIASLVARAQAQRPRLAAASERAASYFVARVLTLATLTALIWSFVDPSKVLTATLAVLVVSCPCAFALAVPAALTRALAVLAQRGVLAVHPDALERLASIDHAVFDKTGTLTQTPLGLARCIPLRTSISSAEALTLGAALASGSRHPASRAIANAAANESLPAVTDRLAWAGDGLQGSIAGQSLRLGRRAFALQVIAETNAGRPALPMTAIPEDAVLLVDTEGPVAAFVLSERLREDAAATLAALQAQGVQVAILSGDTPDKVAALARRVGVTQWQGAMRPEDKLAYLQAQRAEGARVLAVGDGINDAPVLAGADVAVSLASAAELAQASSDIVLTHARLGTLVEARTIATQTMTILRQNQRWALIYNLSAVPFAAMGWVPPWLAALGMSLSSLIVVLNALRVGRRSPALDPQSATPKPAIVEPAT